jgi:hypothetical protein
MFPDLSEASTRAAFAPARRRLRPPPGAPTCRRGDSITFNRSVYAMPASDYKYSGWLIRQLRRMDRHPAKATHPICDRVDGGAQCPPARPSRDNCSLEQDVWPHPEDPQPRSNADMRRALEAGERSAEVAAFYVRQARLKRIKRRARHSFLAMKATARRKARAIARAEGVDLPKRAIPLVLPQGFGMRMRSWITTWCQRPLAWWFGQGTGARHD